ncbi:MAG: PAS domain S-box protein [Acidiferrobacterales bacterium]|nr:PAS domain S-box protein [Acidiferrobacterales bacterium]
MSKRELRRSQLQKQWPTKRAESRPGSRNRRDTAGTEPSSSVGKLGLIVESSNDAIVTKTLDGTITSWNRGAERLYGYKAKEAIGRLISLIIPPERSDEMAEILSRIGRGERIEHFETIRMKKGGERIEISVTISPLYDATGKTIGASAIARDIREQKLREKELEQRIAERTSILNLLRSVASAANKADTFEEAVEFVLRRVSEHNGWCFGHVFVPVENSPEELRALDVYYEQAPGRFAPFCAATLKTTVQRGQGLPGQVYATGKPGWTNDVAADLEARRARIADRLDVATGMAFPILVGSDVVAVLEFFADRAFVPDEATLDAMASVGVQLGLVAERIRLRRHEAELAHASRVSTLGELVANLTHELGQPLAAIANYVGGAVRRLQSHPEVDPKVLKRLKQAAELTQQAAGIVNTMRDFVRKKEIRFESLDMNAVVRRTAGLVAAEARHSGVEVELQTAPTLPRVKAAGVQIEQILLNLMINAIEAMQGEPGPRRLTVRTFENGMHEVETAVRDTGQGVSAEIVDRMFEPFVSSKSEGLGMGLSIARSIVETHHGRLWAERNPERGMTFHMTLPVVEGALD